MVLVKKVNYNAGYLFGNDKKLNFASMRRFKQIGEKWQTLLKALGIAILAFVLSELLSAPFSASTSSIFSSPEKTDFVLSDFFAQVANKRPVRNLSDKVVMVDIDRADRDGIAELLSTIALCAPKAVGVDINFEEARDDDSKLLEALGSIPTVVLPLGLEKEGKTGGSFRIAERPFFFGSLPGVGYGAANLPGKYAISSIREFPVGFPIEGGDTIPSFVVAIAEKVDPEAYGKLLERGNEVETIDYASLEIPVMSIADVYETPEALEGKIVMVGAVNEASDMHSTPVARAMAGLSIHAYALSTVLSGNYYSTCPRGLDYLISAVLCFILVYLNIAIKAKVKGLFLRILQVVLVYLIVRIGYSLYVDQRIIVNFALTLLMVAFGSFAIDIWNGTEGLIEIISGWWKRLFVRGRRSVENG